MSKMKALGLLQADFNLLAHYDRIIVLQQMVMVDKHTIYSTLNTSA